MDQEEGGGVAWGGWSGGSTGQGYAVDMMIDIEEWWSLGINKQGLWILYRWLRWLKLKPLCFICDVKARMAVSALLRVREANKQNQLGNMLQFQSMENPDQSVTATESSKNFTDP